MAAPSISAILNLDIGPALAALGKLTSATSRALSGIASTAIRGSSPGLAPVSPAATAAATAAAGRLTAATTASALASRNATRATLASVQARAREAVAARAATIATVASTAAQVKANATRVAATQSMTAATRAQLQATAATGRANAAVAAAVAAPSSARTARAAATLTTATTARAAAAAALTAARTDRADATLAATRAATTAATTTATRAAATAAAQTARTAAAAATQAATAAGTARGGVASAAQAAAAASTAARPGPPQPPLSQGPQFAAGRTALGGAVGNLGAIAGGVGGGIGSVMLWQVAEDMAKLQRADLKRQGKDVRDDFQREQLERFQDQTRLIIRGQKEMDRIGDSFKDLTKGYEGAIADIAETTERALKDNERGFERMARQGDALGRSNRYQQEDYAKALKATEDDRRISMERTLRDRDQLERNYGRTIDSIEKNRVRRVEDYGETIAAINLDQRRAQEDVNRDVGRHYEDVAQAEKELGIQQKQRVEDLQAQQQDQGLDRAIGGLSLLQAMKSGNMIGILSAVRNLRNLRRQKEETQEQLDRGGLTELDQARLDAQRRDQARRLTDIGTGVTRGNEDRQIAYDRAGVGLRRGEEDDAIALTRAWEDAQEALVGINDRINDIQRAYDAQISAAETQNTRFWEQYQADVGAYYADVRTLEEQNQQIVADGNKARQKAYEEAESVYKGLLRQQDDLLDRHQTAVTAYTRQVTLADTMLERQEASLKLQKEMADQQEKMGKAFNILFLGMLLTNLAAAVAGIGGLFTFMTKAAVATRVLAAGKGIAAANEAAAAVTMTAGGVIKGGGAIAAGVAGGVAAVGVAGELNLFDLGKGTTIPGTNIPIQAPKISAAMGAWENQHGQALAIADIFGAKDDTEVVARIEGGLRGGTSSYSIVMDMMTNPGKYFGTLISKVTGQPLWTGIGSTDYGPSGDWDPPTGPTVPSTHTNASGAIGGFAHGGVIGEPAAIISLLSGRMLGTMAERGPERIVPSDAQARRMARGDIGVVLDSRTLEDARTQRGSAQVGGAVAAGAGLGVQMGDIVINWRGDAGNASDRQRLAEVVHIEVLRRIAYGMRQRGLVQ